MFSADNDHFLVAAQAGASMNHLLVPASAVFIICGIGICI
jgi:hypothetical protein